MAKTKTTDEPLTTVRSRVEKALMLGTRFRRDDVRRLCDTAARVEDYERLVAAAKALGAHPDIRPDAEAVRELDAALASFAH